MSHVRSGVERIRTSPDCLRRTRTVWDRGHRGSRYAGGGDAGESFGAEADKAARSPARRDTDHVAVDLALDRGDSNLPLARHHEYALVVLEGSVTVDGADLVPGRLGYLGVGRDELALSSTGTARALLVGGAPFQEKLVMWWNYVARSRKKVTEAHRSWLEDDGRFGEVASALPRIVVDAPPW